ncbi:hypothetical protein [Alteromonas mediterranea]|uniref:Uncharacterized protein n=1 Tax=Alteromonas mediterranea TaxID=314275 RepID=A0AAC9F6R4_9ALTE|nr:hypothetical protein [Alteromonas mediterranea]AFV84415.1 hypothetical protein amad1_04455 [Alteromonas mediterranea DE1]AGP96422.1 hypothetical protein I635_04425 [Alteromonas mediterranea UM7]AMJ77605.1 hypothetical protein AV942_04385 [Alteromonas mediterranea]AMJ81750.1 hypothetical protein AV941_04405 [Alteromonas mediterranea]HBL21759.1 hypothetical protein [Alteromonas mediterranea]
MLEHPPIPNFDKVRAEYCISDFITRSSDGILVLYVPKDKVSDKAQKGFVSLKQLENLQSKLKREFGTSTEIVLLDVDSLTKVSEGFVALLKSTFQDIITDAHISFLNAHRVSATIVLTEFVENSKKDAVEAFLTAILTPAHIELQAVQWDEVELPSLIEILTTTKKYQPVKLDNLDNFLSKNYPALRIDWLNKQLDKLIKKKLLVRERNTETYAMTALGLNLLPNIVSRNSSDIVRALDLGRRKW